MSPRPSSDTPPIQLEKRGTTSSIGSISGGVPGVVLFAYAWPLPVATSIMTFSEKSSGER